MTATEQQQAANILPTPRASSVVEWYDKYIRLHERGWVKLDVSR